MIANFIEQIPKHLKDKSGSIFYSGANAFSGEKDLYILGLNPGGSPSEHVDETVASSIAHILENKAKDWSAYRDEPWEGAPPGTWRMQPRVLHLLTKLGLNPGEIPASNVIFVRSQRESYIRSEIHQLFQDCWPFHQKVIEELKPKAILCFGKTAGKLIRQKLNANKLIDEFIEENNRKWRTQAFINNEGIKIIVAAHPSVADWRAQDTDPSKMIQRVLGTERAET